jgi:hypothetical protein
MRNLRRLPRFCRTLGHDETLVEKALAAHEIGLGLVAPLWFVQLKSAAFCQNAGWGTDGRVDLL